MTYLDMSVALAELLAEDRRPNAELWQGQVVSSRLLEYELWNRVHSKGLTDSHGAEARELLNCFSFIELVPLV